MSVSQTERDERAILENPHSNIAIPQSLLLRADEVIR
jgi:hypothetical protein